MATTATNDEMVNSKNKLHLEDSIFEASSFEDGTAEFCKTAKLHHRRPAAADGPSKFFETNRKKNDFIEAGLHKSKM